MSPGQCSVSCPSVGPSVLRPWGSPWQGQAPAAEGRAWQGGDRARMGRGGASLPQSGFRAQHRRSVGARERRAEEVQVGQGCLLRDSRVCIFRGGGWASLESLGRGEGQREIREREGRKQAGETGKKEGREEGETERELGCKRPRLEPSEQRQTVYPVLQRHGHSCFRGCDWLERLG